MNESLLRLKQVVARTGRSRSAIYAAMADGTFPASVKIGARSVAWAASAIDRWIADRIGGKAVAPEAA